MAHDSVKGWSLLCRVQGSVWCIIQNKFVSELYYVGEAPQPPRRGRAWCVCLEVYIHYMEEKQHKVYLYVLDYGPLY